MTVYPEIVEVQERIANIRKLARDEAIAACRQIERHLKEALNGESLQGLPNIGTNGRTYYGVRIRTHRPSQPVEPGRPALCLSPEGALVIVHIPMLGVEPIEVVSALDGDLWAEDAEMLPGAVDYVVQKHVQRTKANCERYEKLLKVAKVVQEALG